LLFERLSPLPDITVGAIVHPSSNLADFYREMGDLFGVELKPHNRWGGFKALRERWQSHLEGTLLRPLLLIDEAQEMPPSVLSELRLLASQQFDSRTLLTVVLAGDHRLTAKLRRDELLPLGSRIRARLIMEYADRETLIACLKHLQITAGNASLMTTELMQTLCDHAAGNYRVLTSMAAELLASAAQQEITQLDEKLYLEVFSSPTANARKRA
jgi:type II secretory pathway predicted ATPase ExeA